MYNYYYNISSLRCGVITDYVGNTNSLMQMFVIYDNRYRICLLLLNNKFVTIFERSFF
jgi:hypothetical protein